MIKNLTLHDGDVICIPSDLPIEPRQLMEDLRQIHPGKRFLVIYGDIQQLTESDMNSAGWFKKDAQP